MEAEELIGLELENQCATCKHYSVEGVKCAAFPIAIPTVIFIDEFDHKGPYPDDNGIQYEKATGTQNRFELNIGRRIEDLTDKIDSLRLHKPGGKGHNQKLHGNRAKVGSFMDVAGQTDEEKAAFTQMSADGRTVTDSMAANIRDDWTLKDYGAIEQMRQRFIDGKPTFEDRRLVQSMEAAPTFNGPVYRGMNFDNTANRNAFESIKSNYTTGSEVTMPGLNSFSAKRSEAYGFSEMRLTDGLSGQIKSERTNLSNNMRNGTDHVVMKVTSKTMRDIRDYSKFPEEFEAVSMPNTRYRVTGTKTITATDEQTKSGRQNIVSGRNVTKNSQLYVIEMEEI